MVHRRHMKHGITFTEILIAIFIVLVSGFLAFGKLFHSFGW